MLGWLSLSLLSLVSSLPYKEREANYRALPDDVGANGGKYKLIFANAVWRHGDRSPEIGLPGEGTDAFTEDDWQFGGGGYGELSPAGMKQHYRVGTKLGERYMNQFNFLSTRYRAKEIYIRSTDYNRTLISAYANLAGMYYGSGNPDTDMPSINGWPAGWVPIPVHTVVNKYDYAGNSDAECKRKTQTRSLIINSVEFKNYNADTQVKATLDYLSQKANSPVTMTNSYWFKDTMACEKFHLAELAGPNANIMDWYDWYYAGNVEDMLSNILAKTIDFQDGLGNPSGVDGIDVSLEMPKMRAGDTLNTIYEEIRGALNCYRDSSAENCREVYKKRKYFALSAHDKTVAALLTLLGVKQYVIPLGYPDYAATALIELYVEEESSDPFFKVLYLASPTDNFKAVTNYVRGCPLTEEYCPLSVLENIVDVYVPKPDMVTYCNIDLFDDSTSSVKP